ncbi:3',5'-cyclic AMP phosphodiesterase CpdA [Roseovarius marisflavi]|uniref:3',5'-cyclic AMP phosphodiesterase CpdA n=1 Tax=Roseovarius marisflavi TaxID=1054996 RepID=A0A1M6XCN5_9RHOB|nr:phosphodiesterase [Roseovarius marisflavi]SHL03555.1 3',5'-cyclic AMP phosphodiesterase CpdA [Roseovarius marisflavi]
MTADRAESTQTGNTRTGDTRIIWLSDLHFEEYGTVLGHDPRARLDVTISFINKNYGAADLCLISGDMVETATPANYRALATELDRLAIPWWPMTGNHDDRAMVPEHLGLPDGAMPGFAQYAIELPQARVLCLDSLNPGVASGLLCAERLDWLERALLANPDKATLVFLHHPPMALDLPMLDPDRLENGAALLDLLARFPAVRQLCFGHVHRPVSGHIGRIAFSSLRSALYQAPPPVPTWNWESFTPAAEAPDLGIITLHDDQTNIAFLPFCAVSLGVNGVPH